MEKENLSSFQNYFIISILAIGFIPIVVGLLEYGGRIPLVVSFKITGGFLNPGMFANFIASIFPFALSIVSLKGDPSKWVKRAAFFFLLAATGILVVSNARSAWIGSSISAIFVFSHNRKFVEAVKTLFNSNIKTLIVIIAVTIGIVIVSFFLYNLKKDSADGRLFIWKLCVDLIKEKPVFGIGNGYNSFPKAFNARQRSYFARNPHDTENGLLADDAKYAFNDYLQLMIDAVLFIEAVDETVYSGVSCRANLLKPRCLTTEILPAVHTGLDFSDVIFVLLFHHFLLKCRSDLKLIVVKIDPHLFENAFEMAHGKRLVPLHRLLE